MLHDAPLRRGRAGPASCRIASGTPTLPASCSRAATSTSSSAALVEAELLADAHGPFGQARAVHAGVEVLQVQHLVERADGRLPRARGPAPRAPGCAAGPRRTRPGRRQRCGRPSGLTGASVQSTAVRRCSCRGTGARQAADGPQRRARGQDAARRSRRPWPRSRGAAAWRCESAEAHLARASRVGVHPDAAARPLPTPAGVLNDVPQAAA